jgi:hypothetical protein
LKVSEEGTKPIHLISSNEWSPIPLIRWPKNVFIIWYLILVCLTFELLFCRQCVTHLLEHCHHCVEPRRICRLGNTQFQRGVYPFQPLCRIPWPFVLGWCGSVQTWPIFWRHWNSAWSCKSRTDCKIWFWYGVEDMNTVNVY